MTTILIIDDSEADRYIYRRYLETYAGRYEVHEAKNSRCGLTLAGQLNPDCILLDLKLGGAESGLDVLQKLVGGAEHPDRTVILITGYSSEVLKQRALSHGAADFLVKGKGTSAEALDLAIQQAVRKTTTLGA